MKARAIRPRKAKTVTEKSNLDKWEDVCTCEECLTINHLTQSPSYYSQIPTRANISHRPQTRNLQQHLYTINWKEEDKKLLLSSCTTLLRFVWERNMVSSTLTCQKNNVTPRNNFGPRKSICRRSQNKRFVAQNIFLQHLCSKTAQDRTVERVCLQEDPHPVDGHHRICNRWRKRFISTSPKTAVRTSPSHLHMVYWKALDFTSRWTPRRRKRSHENVKQTDVFHWVNVIKVE